MELQDGIVRQHINTWLNEYGGTEVEIRELIRCVISLISLSLSLSLTHTHMVYKG